jgi:mannonate dehydratase
LDEVLPVAEAAGVRLALHPDDPPMPTIRGQPRLVYQPSLYQRVIDLNASPANQLEFCVGSVAEMTEGDVYAAVDRYARQNRIGYVHLRNVRDKVPHYKETFIDDGDVDVLRVLAILRRNGFEGVIIPDHAPQMSCAAPWHAGMAFAMGYLRAGIQAVA